MEADMAGTIYNPTQHRIVSDTMSAVAKPPPGRPRDPEIDGRVLTIARAHLASRGYEAMSLAAIAAEAGTTRQAIYRRWPTKADLAIAAIAAMSRAAERTPTDDPYADLVRELRAYASGVGRPGGVSMVGTMLLDATDPELVARYRERIVAPRRARLRATLTRARDAGDVAADADIEAVLPMLTGAYYASALAGVAPGDDWAARTAALAWRALGGGPR
jgi:AcrR family transcriptional regulator